MPSHLSSIGFHPFSDKPDMDIVTFLAAIALAAGERTTVPCGILSKWEIEPCIQIWGLYDHEGLMMDMNPHFNGRSRLRVQIKDFYPEARIISAWTLEQNDQIHVPLITTDEADDERPISFPIAFNVPDHALYDKSLCKTIHTVQVTGFAYSIGRNDDTQHDAARSPIKPREKNIEQSKAKPLRKRIASQSYFPFGLYNVEDQAWAHKETPEALVIMSGYVRALKKITNATTKAPFCWALLETFENALIDIVIDDEIVPVDLRVGDCIQGTFWLSGKLVSDAQPLPTLESDERYEMTFLEKMCRTYPMFQNIMTVLFTPIRMKTLCRKLLQKVRTKII